MTKKATYPEESDQSLVQRSLENADTFGIIVKRYWNRLFRYVRRISFSTDEDIEDLLQETFIKTYKNLNAYDSNLSFSTWIYRICRNTVIDSIRRKSVRPATVWLDGNDIEHLFEENGDFLRRIAQRDQLHQISLLIESLPILYRDILVLRFLEEKSYEEIMDIVRKPKGTVASLINRGRKMLLERAREEHLIDS